MKPDLNPDLVLVAILGGVIPSIIWLLYWLREDRRHPEPKKMILLTFVAGLVAVPLVLPFEKFACSLMRSYCLANGSIGLPVIMLWAFIEEFFKFAAAWVVALRSKYMDEPVDAVVYMISAALGFAALENTFFMLGSLLQGNILESALTGNLRFVGASVLHTVSSAAIGVAMALSYYRRKTIRHEYLIGGIIFAGIFHTIFNFYIMQSSEGNIFSIFSFVWFTAIILLLFFERIKRIHRSPIKIRK